MRRKKHSSVHNDNNEGAKKVKTVSSLRTSSMMRSHRQFVLSVLPRKQTCHARCQQKQTNRCLPPDFHKPSLITTVTLILISYYLLLMRISPQTKDLHNQQHNRQHELLQSEELANCSSKRRIFMSCCSAHALSSPHSLVSKRTTTEPGRPATMIHEYGRRLRELVGYDSRAGMIDPGFCERLDSF